MSVETPGVWRPEHSEGATRGLRVSIDSSSHWCLTPMATYLDSDDITIAHSNSHLAGGNYVHV